MLELGKAVTEFMLAISLATGQAQPLPDESLVPGGLALIDIPGQHAQAPQAYYRKQQVMVLPQDNNGHWKAVVGIPLSTKAGTQKIQLSDGNNLNFDVADKKYKEQHIQIKNKRKVNPEALDMKRINKEKKLMVSAFKHWQDSPGVARLKLPTQGPYSSPFGLKRFFNGQPRNPHSGLDIAAPAGTAIKAPAPAQVVVTGDFFFNGNTVMLDHGQGLVSMYCHLSNIEVEQGQLVNADQVIGKVGSTGRATGPHLHWSISLNNVRIDPQLMLLESSLNTGAGDGH